MHFEIFKASNMGFSEWWYWRLRAKNGRIVADGSEPYGSRSNARRAARRVERALQYDSFGQPLEIKYA